MEKRKIFSVSIKDCDVTTFTVGGHGGSGKDTSNTGVRVTHIASGATGIGVDHRSQLKNKQDAFVRMANSEKFRKWLKLMIAELMSGVSIDELVDRQLIASNLKVEARTEKGWVEIE